MSSRFAVTVEGRPHRVELDEREGKLHVTVDDHVRVLDARRVAEGVWSLLDGNDARLIQVDGALPKLTVSVSHPDGEPRLCAVEVTSAPAEAAAPEATGAGQSGRVTDKVTVPARPAGPVTVRSPIPGRLVKVLVKAGDAVQAGQALLILEAMKMENEVRAPRAGTVSAVRAVEGAAVESDQDLVTLA